MSRFAAILRAIGGSRETPVRETHVPDRRPARRALRSRRPPREPRHVVRLFLSHRARATKKTAKFAKILDVHLIDGFRDGHFDLTAAGDFFVATTDGAAGGLAGRTHLRAYKLKAVKAIAEATCSSCRSR